MVKEKTIRLYGCKERKPIPVKKKYSYNPRRRMLFIRVTAIVLAVLIALTAFSALIFGM